MWNRCPAEGVKVHMIPLAALALLSQLAPAAKLHIGSPAPPLAVGKWIKGAPITKFKPGKEYVVEFWATWCPPCRTTIPHLTELSKKYPNITFIGVSIWEYNQTAVRPFVTQMGSKMDYHVAIDRQKSFTEQYGTMAKTWMAAAGQNGIPTAFLINKSGKIAWIGDPSVLDSQLAKS